MSNHIVTVFTPTYNRADLLPFLFESLCKQINKDFLWLIVDGESNDGTKEMVDEFKSKGIIDIEFMNNPDRSKYTAMVKCAFKVVESELVFFVDSDDTVSNDAIDTIIRNHINNVNANSVAGYIYLCEYPKSKFLIKPLNDGEVIKETIIERRRNDSVDTCCQVYKTKVLKQYDFPVFDEVFTPESVIWGRIDKDYNVMTFNKTIYFREYQDGGYTKDGKKKLFLSPMSAMESKRFSMVKGVAITTKIKANLSYVMYGFASKLSYKEMLNTSPDKYVSIIVTPFSFVLWLYYKRKYKL